MPVRRPMSARVYICIPEKISNTHFPPTLEAKNNNMCPIFVTATRILYPLPRAGVNQPVNIVFTH